MWGAKRSRGEALDHRTQGMKSFTGQDAYGFLPAVFARGEDGMRCRPLRLRLADEKQQQCQARRRSDRGCECDHGDAVAGVERGRDEVSERHRAE